MTAPKRRWSYSLRTLFVVVTVFGCWFGWMGFLIRASISTADIIKGAIFGGVYVASATFLLATPTAERVARVSQDRSAHCSDPGPAPQIWDTHNRPCVKGRGRFFSYEKGLAGVQGRQ